MSHPAALSTGRFVWHEIRTPDLSRTIQFYRDLFHWTVVPPGENGPSARIELAGKPIGRMAQTSGLPGEAAGWMAFVTVDRVEAALSRATQGGGQVLEQVQDEPEFGRFAAVADPAGARFCVFQRHHHPGPEEVDFLTGAFCWDELLTPDPASAAAFYRDTIGWNHKVEDMGSAGVYWLFTSGGRERAGMATSESGAPPRWLPYILVREVDESAGMIRGLGGKILAPPHDIPKIGRSALAADPAGAAFALFAPEAAA